MSRERIRVRTSTSIAKYEGGKKVEEFNSSDMINKEITNTKQTNIGGINNGVK